MTGSDTGRETGPVKVDLKPGQLAALLLVFLSVFSVAITIAFNIDVIIEAFGASRSEAGFIVTAEGIGVSIGSILCSRVLTKYRTRPLLFAGSIMFVAANALTLIAPNVMTMAACRVLGGLGTGVVICVVMATAARTVKPELTFGFVSGSVGAFLALLAISVPWAIGLAGFDGAYGLYTALSVLGLLLIPLIPNTQAPAHGAPAAAATSQTSRNMLKANAGWIALVGMALFFFAQAGIGAFVARIGDTKGVSLETVGLLYFVAGLMTIVVPIAAGIVGSRFGSTKPLILVGCLMAMAASSISMGLGILPFYIGVPLNVILPSLMLPSFLGGLAVLDPSGRLAGIHPAFATMGGALGPAASGLVADQGGFAMLGWFIIAVLTLAILLMSAGTVKADILRSGGAEPQPA